MKIQTVEIENLLAYRQAALALDRPVSLVLGLNETGKSSLAAAL